MSERRESLPDAPNIATLLNDLFIHYRHESGREYTNREVEEGIKTMAGRRLMDESTIWRMRSGGAKKPSMDVVEALCMFFPVDVSYFYPRLAALRDRQQGRSAAEQVKVALRKTSLDPLVQDHVAGLVQALTDQLPNAGQVPHRGTSDAHTET